MGAAAGSAGNPNKERYADQVNQRVQDNVQNAFAQRGLDYTPASDFSAAETNQTVTANLNAVESGRYRRC